MDADPELRLDSVEALSRIVYALGDELAAFRHRALDAERRVRDFVAEQAEAASAAGLASPGGSARTREDAAARVRALEAENAELRARLVEAADRARAVASRIRFARQQDDVAAASEEVA